MYKFVKKKRYVKVGTKMKPRGTVRVKEKVHHRRGKHRR